MTSAYALSDTIIAPATAPAQSAIGVLRLSGPDAWRIAQALCTGLPQRPRARQAYVVQLVPVGAELARPVGTGGAGGRASDSRGGHGGPPHPGRASSAPTTEKCVLTLWRAPRSYTGEDLAELSLHGNPLLLRAVQQAALDAARALGVPLRPAEAGEFTYRAYLSGKLDLAQAEAVQQVISAGSARALALAEAQLGGSVSQRVRAWVERLTRLLAQIEVTHDYGADDLDASLDPALLLTPVQLDAALAALCGELAAAQDEARRTAPLRSGVTVAICGPPNVGKSTLFNALLGHERALTAPEPGTTRDYLTEALHAGGLRLTLVDTAGYRDVADAVEAAGVRRAGDWAHSADQLLWVTAADAPPAAQALPPALAQLEPLQVVTRCDLLPAWPEPEALPRAVCVSGATGRGVPELRAELQARAEALGEPALDALTERQAAQAAQAAAALGEARAALAAGLPLDAVAMDMYSAVAALRQVYEHPDREAVVQAVFSGFCVGK
jgi:tRNA modification GTPase